MTRLMRNLAVAALVAVGAAGCTQFQLPDSAIVAPKSSQQTVALAYAQLGAAYGLLADLAQRGRLTKPEAQRTLEQLEQLRITLDTAAGAGNTQGVQSVTQALIAVESTLKARSAQ